MIDVLVPVLKRPDSAKRVSDSLANATVNEYRLYFICSPGDRKQIRACEGLGEILIVDWHPDRADYARKINHAFSVTDSEWVFQGADDISFHPGWDREAITRSALQKKSVVGTNDLHNPSVKARNHATHILFRRDYIERYGSGTIDDTGLVLCELYDHQYVDNEFVQTAIARDEWVFAEHSVVEHLHPHWGLSGYDSTYRKATRATRNDRRLFQQRVAAMGLGRRVRGRSVRSR